MNYFRYLSSFLLLVILLSHQVNAQDRVIYTGLINFIPEDKNFPLIGFINVVNGDHTSAQFAFMNYSRGSFRGFQAGLLNDKLVDVRGAQFGLINNVSDKVSGGQFGLINRSGDVEGVQMGLINYGADIVGSQMALINSSKKVEGAQIGLFNKATSVEGAQIGIINKSDDIGESIPIGLVYLGKGGHQSISFGFTEMHPAQITFRSGIDRLYFMMSAACSDNKDGYLLLGTGVGTQLSMTERSSFRPEFQYLSGLGTGRNFDYFSISLNYAYVLSNRLEFLAGPALGYNLAPRGKTISDNSPFIDLSDNQGTSRLESIVGFRASILVKVHK